MTNDEPAGMAAVLRDPTLTEDQQQSIRETLECLARARQAVNLALHEQLPECLSNLSAEQVTALNGFVGRLAGQVIAEYSKLLVAETVRMAKAAQKQAH